MEKTQNFSLSTKKLKEIPFHMYENDFTFIVNKKPFKTSRFVADIISPLIRQLHYSDQSINEFHVNIQSTVKITNTNNTNESSSSSEYFDEFLQLATFKSIKIDPERQKYFSQYFYALGNVDEFFNIQPSYFNDLTPENALDRLESIAIFFGRNIETIEMKDNDVMTRIIDFISTNFENIDKERLKKMNVDVIEMIISNENLKLYEEDSLLQFILGLYNEDHSNSRLFEYVLFNNISEELIQVFIQKFDIEYLNSNIWRSICCRLKKSLETTDEKRYLEKANVMKIEYEKGNELNGILRHLTNETGSNIHDNGTIEITANVITSSSCHPRNLVDYQSENYYNTKNDGNAIVCFDFKDKSVNLTSYSIKSNGNGSGDNNLKNWTIEVSNDGQKWEEVDQRTNDSSLKGCDIICLFNVQKKNNNFYRFIRLRQTGETWLNQSNKYFWFKSIEFYGKMKNKLNNK